MKKRSTKRTLATAPVVIHRNDVASIRSFFVEHAQALAPMVDVVSSCKHTIDEVIAAAGQAMIETVLSLSAQQLAGPKRQGCREAGRELLWHGSHPGRVVLGERELRVNRPRLRTRGPDAREVPIPAYEAMRRDARLGQRMYKIVLAGVSTRRYAQVLPAMAETVGVSRSQVSRRAIVASERALAALIRLKPTPALIRWLSSTNIIDARKQSRNLMLGPRPRSLCKQFRYP